MKNQSLIEQMTLEEKAAFLSGKSEWESRNYDRLNIPSIFLSDGPNGVRKQEGEGDHLGLHESVKATCFPPSATVANSWDVTLAERIGTALGEEASALNVDILLGPGINIKRSPLCGRNFEYYSEDPYLSGKLGAGYVRGVQSQGVYACPKHFAANSQELRRMAMNAVVDERTLREIYLTAFEIVMKEADAHVIMSSYNQVNGTYANENEHLLNEILRGEWGFDGMVVSDWGGSNDAVSAAKAGSNLEMPNPGFDSARQIVRAVKEGRLEESVLDQRVDELLTVFLDLAEKRSHRKKSFDVDAHHELAKQAARESAILLKNLERILPLQAGTKVAVIGDFAFDPRYQGAGSSMVNATKVDSIEQAIGSYDLEVVGMSRGYERNGGEDVVLRKEALDLAGEADVVLYFMGLNEISESEGLDRNHMRIPQNQIDLLSSLYQANSNIVGVISAGSAIEMPWETNLKGILHGYLAGQAGAEAILDILTGKVNPSGHLNETIPMHYEDTPAFRNYPSMERNSEYRESIFVGYRYYDTCEVRVQYPFGFGLSYTEFTYSDLSVDEDGITLTVTNTGKRDGAEVVQMYVGMKNGIIFRPRKELKGFAKVFLKAGESKEVKIPFDDKTFRYYNVKTQQWEVEAGSYQISVGASVSDIRLTGQIEKEGTTSVYPYNPALMQFYYTGIVQMISDAEFEELLGHPIPDGKWAGEIGPNDAICQMYYAKSRLARFVFKKIDEKRLEGEAKGVPDLNVLFIYNMPFRAIAKMTEGMVSLEMVDGIVLAVNGHFWKGLGKVIGGFFRNRKAYKFS